MVRSFEIDQRLVGSVSGWGDAFRGLLVPKEINIVTVYDRKTNSREEVLSDESRVFGCAISSDTSAATTYQLNALKMGRLLRCSSVTYRSRYAPSSRLADDPF